MGHPPLIDSAKVLSERLKAGGLTDKAREALQNNLKRINDRIDRTKNFFKKHNIPL